PAQQRQRRGGHDLRRGPGDRPVGEDAGGGQEAEEEPPEPAEPADGRQSAGRPEEGPDRAGRATEAAPVPAGAGERADQAVRREAGEGPPGGVRPEPPEGPAEPRRAA